MTPEFSVLIASRNEGPALRRTVDDVLRHAPEGRCEIIVVDDASEDGSAQFLEDAYRRCPVRLFRNETRKGLIQSRAIAAESASGRFLHFLDAHRAVESRWLENLAARLREIDNRGIVVPLIHGLDPEGWRLQYEIAPSSGCTIVNPVLDFGWSDPVEVDGKLCTCTMGGLGWTCSRDWYESIGGLDHGMATWGGENIDIPLRTWIAGGFCLVADDVRVGHLYRRTSNWVPLEAQRLADVEYTSNKIRAAHTVFSKKTFRRVLDNLRCFTEFEQAFERVWEDSEGLARLKGRIEAIRCRSEEWILDTFRLPLFEPSFYYRRPVVPGESRRHRPRPLVSLIFASGEPRRSDLDWLREESTYGNWDAIVLRNGNDSAGPSDGLASADRRVRTLVVPPTVNRAKAIVLGAHLGEGEFLAVFDEDTIPVDEHWIEKFLLLFEQRPRLVLAGARTIEHDGVENSALFDTSWDWDAPGMARRRREPLSPVPYATLCCADSVLFLRRKHFLDLGGLDSRYLTPADSWRDFCVRAWLCGGEIACHPEVSAARQRRSADRGVDDLPSGVATAFGAWLTAAKCFSDERRIAACEAAAAPFLRTQHLLGHIRSERESFLRRAKFDDDWLFYKFRIEAPDARE